MDMNMRQSLMLVLRTAKRDEAFNAKLERATRVEFDLKLETCTMYEDEERSTYFLMS